VSKFFQQFVSWAGLFMGIVLLVFAGTGSKYPPHPTDVAQAIIYGAFAGGATVFFFSF
jgi:uncharacterized membrane protein (DUF441 family)